MKESMKERKVVMESRQCLIFRAVKQIICVCINQGLKLLIILVSIYD